MNTFDLMVFALLAVIIMLAILAAGSEIGKSLRDIADELHKLNKLLKQ